MQLSGDRLHPLPPQGRGGALGEAFVPQPPATALQGQQPGVAGGQQDVICVLGAHAVPFLQVTREEGI